jgi:hypothetical protein
MLAHPWKGIDHRRHRSVLRKQRGNPIIGDAAMFGQERVAQPRDRGDDVAIARPPGIDEDVAFAVQPHRAVVQLAEPTRMISSSTIISLAWT